MADDSSTLMSSGNWLATALTGWRPRRPNKLSNLDAPVLDYKIHPLKSKTHIRLLRLDTADGLGSPLTGSFASTDLEGRWRKPYSALSYCWGTPDRHEIILIDGCSLYITEQLRDALRRVRARGCRVIWVDQICINQDDNVEKSQQVRLMDEVYSCATRTYGYLGETDAAEELATACLHHLEINGVGSVEQLNEDSRVGGSEMSARLLSLIRTFIDLRQQRKYDNQTASKAEINLGELLVNVCRISLRPFLSRIWILQEVIMAGPERLELLLGSQVLGWNSVRALVQILRCSGTVVTAPLIGPRVYWRLRMLVQVVVPPKSLGARMHTLPLLVSRFSPYFDCADPRDRFYALHGLALFRPELPTIDYSRSVREVYIDHACYCYAKLSSETILGDLMAKDFVSIDEGNVPSWCPGRPQLEHIAASGILSEVDQDHACGPHGSVMAEPDRHRGVLKTFGAVFDVVLAVPPLDVSLKIELDESIRCPWAVDICEYLVAFFWPVCVGDMARAYALALNKMRALLRTLLERILQLAAGDENVATVYRQLLLKCELTDIELSSTGSDDTVWKARAIQALRDPLPGANSAMSPVLDSLRVFVTKRGFFGLSFKETAPGDVVAVLAGLNMPLMFRPKDNMYQYLWKAQVCGIMQGEVFTKYGADLVSIEIC